MTLAKETSSVPAMSINERCWRWRGGESRGIAPYNDYLARVVLLKCARCVRMGLVSYEFTAECGYSNSPRK